MIRIAVVCCQMRFDCNQAGCIYLNGSIDGNFDYAIGRRRLALMAPRGITGPKAFACHVCECEPRKLRDSGGADRKFHSSMEAGEHSFYRPLPEYAGAAPHASLGARVVPPCHRFRLTRLISLSL